MSFKVIKEFLNQFNPLNFGDIGKVISELEKDHQLKCAALNNLKAGKINSAEFKRQFYWLTDIEDKIAFLKHTFSHDSAFLKIIEKLEKNLEEQKKQIASKNTSFETLQSKLQEEKEILAIEEELVRKTKQEKTEQQQINASFENIKFEPVATKEYLTFDKSLQSLRKRGYERHLRPQEAFAILIAHSEGRLAPSMQSIAKDMLSKGEWLSCAFERQGSILFVYTDPDGLIFDGQKYIKQKFKFTEKKQIIINKLPSKEAIRLADIPRALIEYIYGRQFNDLPQEIRTNSFFFLPKDNQIWPVGRRDCVSNYGVDAYNCYTWISRGVVIGKKIVK